MTTRTRQHALDNFRHQVHVGRYNLLNPSEETLRVFVQWGPGEDERVNFHLDADTGWYPDEYPGAQLQELGQMFIDRMWIASVKPKVETMVAWMEAGEDEGAPDDEFYGPNRDWFDWAWAVREVRSRGARLAQEQERLRALRRFVTDSWADL